MRKSWEKNWKNLCDVVRATDKVILTKVVTSVDGHTIYDPKHFTESGLDESIVEAFTEKLKSNPNDPKQTIFVDGKPVKDLYGVYGLQLLEFIAGVFDVDSWKMGRGSRASHLAEQLVEKFNCTK